MGEHAPMKDIIAARLKDARILAGLSQGQIATKMGLHRPTISEIELGNRNVTAEEIVEFAKHYDVSVEWILSKDTAESENQANKVKLAARELEKLGQKDLDRIMAVLSAIRKQKE
jgi:transcriptional regulator with XRE-family HTH domain